MGILFRRDTCYYNGWDNTCRSSDWYNWGRWVAFAVIVGVAFFIFFLLACYNARNRRTRGLRPHPGTAWLAPPPGPPPPNQPYYADPYYQQQPPPQYTPQPQTYGYFGGQPQQSGIELQSPPHAYSAGGDRAYQPPPGPPPQNGPKT